MAQIITAAEATSTSVVATAQQLVRRLRAPEAGVLGVVLGGVKFALGLLVLVHGLVAVGTLISPVGLSATLRALITALIFLPVGGWLFWTGADTVLGKMIGGRRVDPAPLESTDEA